jgi:hypothetical protein
MLPLVPVIDQPNQRAPHADHVVVGVRAEADHPPLLLAGRVILDRLHQLLKHLVRDLRRRPMMPQELMQIVIAKILVGQLEQRFSRLLAQPDQCPLDQ